MSALGVAGIQGMGSDISSTGSLIVRGEKESYQGELFERAASAVDVGRLSGGHLGDL